MLVEQVAVVEIKSVEQINPAHRMQIQTYLRSSGCRLGHLPNFGAPLPKGGIVPAVNRL